MSKLPILDRIHKGIFYLDGATGSNLQKAGMPVGVCPEQWIIEHRDVLIKLQKAYFEAGSDLVLAPTFTANRIKLAEYGWENDVEKINRELVAISREAAGEEHYVAGDISMTGVQLAPVGTFDFEDLITCYKEQIDILAKAGVDCLLVETMMSLQECRAAVIAAKETCDLPVFVTLTFEADGRTLYGTDAKTAAIVLSHMGVSAIGVNCSTGPEQMVSIVKDMASVTDIPIIAKPNAGLPTLDEDGNTVYNLNAKDFSMECIALVEAGASVLGGCCGSTPEHIKETVKRTKDLPLVKHDKPKKRFLASERKSISYGLDEKIMIIGERINPTGKKALQAQLREGKFDMVREFAEQQEENGADVLDVNMGMNGIDECECMLKAIDEVSMVSNLPLSLDTSHISVMEKALRRYPGRALINSISLEPGKAEALLPLAKKYGAMFILLPLSEAGLPKDFSEKISLINQLVQMAYDAGLTKEDIMVDCLVTTVGANPNAAIEVLECIKYCKEQGFATMGGLSNISFGLPERSFVNAAFMTMAIQAGITCAIANPNQDLLLNSALAADLLMNKPGADLRYIEAINRRKEILEREKEENDRMKAIAKAAISCGSILNQAISGGGDLKEIIQMAEIPVMPGKNASAEGSNQEAVSKESKASAINQSGDKPLTGKLKECYEMVLKGNRAGAVQIVSSAVEEQVQPQDILNLALLPGINAVGDLFDQGKYFLPQLIASAEAMKLAVEYLEPLLVTEVTEEGDKPVVVIATVKGDIHDIGKNLVALMLKNYGFSVIDLGKDVPRELIVETALKEKAEIIALSALMTTTMTEMKRVIDYAKEKNYTGKFMIGGAVITQSYADEIGADGYSKDASEAVKVAKQLTLH